MGMGQDGVRMGQDGIEMSQVRKGMGQDGVRMGQDGIEMSQVRKGMGQDGVRTGQDGIERSQVREGMSQDGIERSQVREGMSQEGVGVSQSGGGVGQDGSVMDHSEGGSGSKPKQYQSILSESEYEDISDDDVGDETTDHDQEAQDRNRTADLTRDHKGEGGSSGVDASVGPGAPIPGQESTEARQYGAGGPGDVVQPLPWVQRSQGRVAFIFGGRGDVADMWGGPTTWSIYQFLLVNRPLSTAQDAAVLALAHFPQPSPVAEELLAMRVINLVDGFRMFGVDVLASVPSGGVVEFAHGFARTG